MEKKKVIRFLGFLAVFALIFLPGYSKFQELAWRNRALEEKARQLELSNKRLEKEVERLRSDSTYVEKVARDKLKVSRKGEIIYELKEGDKGEKR